MEAQGYEQAFRALGDVTHALTSADLDLDDLLHLIAAHTCRLSGVRRCSLYLKDEKTDLFHGRVGHADHDIDAGVQRLVAGVPADRFTQEILQTKKPVLLRNAAQDPRAIRSTMLAWNVRSMLGVPMVLREQVVGIIFLDDIERPHEFTAKEQEVTAAFANLAAAAIAQAQLTTELRASNETAARQNLALRRAATLEDRLTTLVLEGADLRQIAGAVAELANRPCAVYDADKVRRASAVPPGATEEAFDTVLDVHHRDDPQVAEALAALGEKRAAVLGPFGVSQLRRRYLVAPVMARDDVWGYVVLVEQGQRFGAMEALLAPRAATIVALEMSAENRAADAQRDAGESLMSELVRGNRDTASLERRAGWLGIDLNAPHVVALLAVRQGHTAVLPSARDIVARARELDGGERVLLATGVTEGVALLLRNDPAVERRRELQVIKGMLGRLLSELAPEDQLVAAMSARCIEAADYVRGYNEVVDLSRTLFEFRPSGGRRVVSAQELGAGRLLLAGVDRDTATRYLREVLGPLLDVEDARTSDLLLTLRTFLDESRNIRRCAERLEVHENTIRYRLSRIERLLGLDVASDAGDQLTVQTALMVLDLRHGAEDGHLPLPPAG